MRFTRTQSDISGFSTRLSTRLSSGLSTRLSSRLKAQRTHIAPTVAATLAASLFSAPAVAQLPETFTIRQVLSAPFPTEIVSSPASPAIAWVFDERGANNIWLAASPDWKARPLTRFPAETGLELSTPRWLPNGHGLLFVRGGAPNSRGEFPDPAHDPRGTRRVIMLVGTDGKGLREITEGAAPQVAPDGKSVAFTRRGEVWSASLGDSASPARLFVARGVASNLRWAPDGSSLAFTSDRGDHSFVGVYNLAAHSLTYVDPSVDQDEHPIWSPDSRHIAFVREPALTRLPVHAIRRVGLPWSIRIADARTGKGTELWHASNGPGSVFRSVDSDDVLAWTTDRRIVFPWEESGWLHLYSIPVAGGAPIALTPGAFEVQQGVLERDGRTILYVSNQGDIDRRHVWSVPTAGGPAAAVTRGEGLEWEAVSLAGSGVALLHSDAIRPARPAVLLNGNITDVASATIPADFPSDKLVKPVQVIFPSADGLPVHGQLFLPANGVARHAAIVFFHGGSRRQMLLGWHSMGYYHNAYGLNQYLASRGYVVLSVNYRSGIGYGLNFREALSYGPDGASEFNDAKGAARYLKTRTDVDAARIGVWGGSYGGYMTALSLARDPADYKVGVDFAGVHDWNLEWDRWIDTWDTALELASRRVAFASSPMSDLSKWRAPVLLVQGDDDRNVVFSQTVQLAEDLRKRGVHVETLIFPDETHEWLLHEHWISSYEATAEFLERYLK